DRRLSWLGTHALRGLAPAPHPITRPLPAPSRVARATPPVTDRMRSLPGAPRSPRNAELIGSCPGRYSGVQAGASGQSHYQADKQSRTSPRRGMTIAVGACLDAGDLQGFPAAHDAAAHDPVVVQPRRRGVGPERT